MKAEWSTLQTQPSFVPLIICFFLFFLFYISDSIQLCNILAMFSRGEKKAVLRQPGGACKWIKLSTTAASLQWRQVGKREEEGGGGAVFSTGLRGKHFKQMLKCANLGRS